jgi:hypothetical protein
MGQQPNIELGYEDLPRPVPHPAPARRWKPTRPGEVTSPADMPWGGGFGTIGPDAGYVLRLIRERALELAPGEHRHNAEAAIAAIATARASRFGRAPINEDVDLACLLLGFDTDELPAELVEGLRRDRTEWFANLGHDAAARRVIVAAVPMAVLESKPGAVRAQMATGRRLIER